MQSRNLPESTETSKRPALEGILQERLDERSASGALRSVHRAIDKELYDFSSNDYLGIARDGLLLAERDEESKRESFATGSGGSRLISGNHAFMLAAEEEIACFHGAERALLFNSGYDANIGLFSSIALRNVSLVYDELVHASIRDGVRLGFSRSASFRHNDLADLCRRLAAQNNPAVVCVESVYSMDGDFAPLEAIAAICEEFGAALIVDEAHATGWYGAGRGLVRELGLQGRVFARVHTFGKALGCHGAAVVGSAVLISYLSNFARSFIYTTALPGESIQYIRKAYTSLPGFEDRRLALAERCRLFEEKSSSFAPGLYERCPGPIKTFLIGNTEKARHIAGKLRTDGFEVFPILHPTVPAGTERLRICLHSFNTPEECVALCRSLQLLLKEHYDG